MACANWYKAKKKNYRGLKNLDINQEEKVIK